MMRSEDVLARAGDTLERIRQSEKRREGTLVRAGRRAVRATKYGMGGAFVVLVGALVTGLFVPLGVTGILLTFLLMMAAMCFGIFWSAEPEVKADALPQIAIAQLPDQAGRWLDRQRPLLPAPAQRLADGIGVRLDALGPQLERLDEKEPAAAEIRRLIADELPELINGYGRVPHHLRKEGINGISPDRQLVDGLNVVDTELARMSEQIASGDLNSLATQKRYLEIKYQGAE